METGRPKVQGRPQLHNKFDTSQKLVPTFQLSDTSGRYHRSISSLCIGEQSEPQRPSRPGPSENPPSRGPECCAHREDSIWLWLALVVLEVFPCLYHSHKALAFDSCVALHGVSTS